MFVEGVRQAVGRNAEFVPPYGYAASMYVRPLLFASGAMLGLAPLAEEFTFLVTVTPAGGYFGKAVGEEGPEKRGELAPWASCEWPPPGSQVSPTSGPEQRIPMRIPSLGRPLSDEAPKD